MKLIKVCFLSAALVFSTLAARGQNYSIDWYSIDGGGGSSSGGVYTVTGTIGQPDAGVMSGGNYSLVGGFWSIISAVSTPGAPPLKIFTTATNSVVISWPSPSTGFALQQNASLATTSWSQVQQAPKDDGTTRSVVIKPPVGNLFFRLSQ
jgi:hypothetical protein